MDRVETLAVDGTEYLGRLLGLGSPPEPGLFIRRKAEAGFWKMFGHLRPAWRAVLPLHPDAVPMEPPKTAGDVRDLLANTMSQVHSRKMDVRIANSLAYISTSLLRALEVSDLERRLEALSVYLL